MILKKILFWVLAFSITIGAAYYQRVTGPTYPQDIELETTSEIYELELIRSNGANDCRMAFYIPNNDVDAEIKYRRFPTNDQWINASLLRKGDSLIAVLPQQVAAGKIEYEIQFFEKEQKLETNISTHQVIRFKGDVPAWALIPHILFIFIAMLFSNLTAIYAIDKQKRTKLYGILTFVLLALGGMIFGPIVQYYAFGELWTGVPLGWDLTDNKTLIAFLFWFVAVLLNRKEKRLYWYIIAAIVTILIFSIPHSMFGSELDYTNGTISQG